jgi:hypothetical protein
LDNHVAYYENGANDGTVVGEDVCLVRRKVGLAKTGAGLSRKGEGHPRITKAVQEETNTAV